LVKYWQQGLFVLVPQAKQHCKRPTSSASSAVPPSVQLQHALQAFSGRVKYQQPDMLLLLLLLASPLPVILC
jgi:hypothetical protein